jgi:hypothetical protein
MLLRLAMQASDICETVNVDLMIYPISIVGGVLSNRIGGAGREVMGHGEVNLRIA